MDTVFSKIISGEIPAHIVYENDHVIAFLDIAPIHPGHTLVLPKKYARNILDISEESWEHVSRAVRFLAPKIKKAVHADGVNIIMNNEPAGHQIVFHAHVHIVPRFNDDGLTTWAQHSYKENEAEEVLKKIKEAVQQKL